MQSHIVFGAGLIGCYLGGVLTSLKHDTKLVGRLSIEQKLSNGLILTDYLDNCTKIESLDFITSSTAKGSNKTRHSCNFLWLTVKCTGVDQATKDIATLVEPNTIILCCQNGLGSDKVVRERYPKNIVLRVMVLFNVSEIKAGHLHRGSEGDLCIENNTDVGLKISNLVQQINTPLMPVTHTKEMQALLWAKLQLNLGNSVNALANTPVKAMLQQRSYRLVIALLMKELLLVTKALDIQLPKLTAVPATYLPKVLSLPNFLFNLIANKMLAIDPKVRTSMWWDISQGKKTEIDHLNGAILETANRIKIQVPGNKKIIDLIKTIENNTQNHNGIEASVLLNHIKGS